MKIDHIGYLVKDINKSIDAFLQLGFTQESEVFIDNISNENNKARNVDICFLRNGEA